MPEVANRKGTGWLIAYVFIMAMMYVSPSFFVSESSIQVNEFTAPQLKELVAFYGFIVVLFLSVVNYYSKDARIPDTLSVVLNFGLFWLLSTIILIILFTMIAVPTWYFAISGITVGKGSFVQWSVVAFNEGLLALLLIPSIFRWGEYIHGNSVARGNILGVNYDIPGWNRIKYGLPASGFMALLHFAAYKGSITSMGLAFLMFSLFWILRESFGFGAAEGLHFGWNFAIVYVFSPGGM